MPAASEGSDVHSTHLTANILERSWDTRVQRSAHAHTLGKETEREVISSVPSHAEWFIVWNLFPHGALLLSALLHFSPLTDRV